MADLPRCAGPGCRRRIRDGSPSPFFCGELCAATWLKQWLRTLRP